MKARIAQCLCPQRHAIVAYVFNDPETDDARCKQMLLAAVGVLLAGGGRTLGAPLDKINPWCGICGTHKSSWIYEVCWTKEFDTYEQALAVVKELEAEQIVGRAILDMMGETHDAKRHRMN
jgi:hypothetical protein